MSDLSAHKHGRPFMLYRIICTITGRALIMGSDWPHDHRCPPSFPRETGQWYERGQWGTKGQFWRTPYGIHTHLRNLCCDWNTVMDRQYGRITTRHAKIAGPDWSRLEHLLVEQTTVTNYSISEIPAKDFVGLVARAA